MKAQTCKGLDFSGPPDCADVCGGSSVIEEFSIDGDGDFFCQPNSMVEYCTADVVNDTPGVCSPSLRVESRISIFLFIRILYL